MRPIDIGPADLETVRRILREHTPRLEVRAFGSRVSWTARETSDLDLALMTAEPLSIARMAKLKAAFTASDLPFRVDIVDWASTSENFRKVIERDHVVLAARNGEPSDGRNSAGADEWATTTIKELADKVAMGPFGSSIKVDTFVSEGVPIISGQHLHGFRVDDEPGFNFISPEHAQQLANANVQHGDIVFTHAGNIGQVSCIPADSKFERYVISQRQFYMRCDRSKAAPEFVTMYFRSPEGQHQLLANTSQVGVPSIAQPVTYLRTIQLRLPPLSEQRAIAHILGTLDDKIELNRRMNETLEALARALFTSWFVTFDPVRAKMAGRDPGLPKHIADLFPDRFVESEMGEIPEGWEVKGLDTIADFQNGLALQNFRPREDEARLPVVKIAQLRSGRPDSVEWASASIKPECIITDGDVVFSWSGSLMAKIWSGGRAALNQHLFKVTSTDFPKWFYLYSTLAHLLEFQRIAEGKATTMGHIKRHHLSEALCIVPNRTLLSAADGTLSNLLEMRILIDQQSRTLTALRDTLLPKLVSGEVRVNVADRLIEEAM